MAATSPQELLIELGATKNIRKREKSFSEGTSESLKKKVKFDLHSYQSYSDKTELSECIRENSNEKMAIVPEDFPSLFEQMVSSKNTSSRNPEKKTDQKVVETNLEKNESMQVPLTDSNSQARDQNADHLEVIGPFGNEVVSKEQDQASRHNRTKRKLSEDLSSLSYDKKSRMTTASPQNEVIDKQEAQLDNPRTDQRKKHFDIDNNIPKIESRSRRTSVPTAELARLKNLVHDQENHILFLQSQMDNAEPHSLSLDVLKQMGDRDGFRDIQKVPPAMDRRCFSLEPSSLHGYSCLSLNSFGNEAPNEVRLIEENESLRSELQDVKDQVELLEFRIFEYTEADPKDASQINLELASSSSETCDMNASRSRKSSCSSVLDSHNTQTCTTPLLSAASDALRKDPHVTIDTSISSKDGTSVNMDSSQTTLKQSAKQGKLADTLNEVLINLEASALQPTNSNEEFLSMVEKLRGTVTSLGELDDQLVTLMKENKTLHDTVASLNESHETRTEASGTESELVHGKSPSVSSDLSDTECDFQTRDIIKNRSIDAATSFQESGIFDAPNEFTESATQTSDMDDNTKEIKLQEALEKLSILQASIQGKLHDDMKFHDLQESDEYLLKDQKKYILINRQEYDSMIAKEKEFLHTIQKTEEENQNLKKEINQLRKQVKRFESDAYSEETEVMKGAVRALQERLASSERSKEQFFEEKCEYEEAENDARLMAQRLQGQLDAAQEMESLLSASLSQEQEFCRDLQRRLREYQQFEKESGEREEELLARLNKTNEAYASLMTNFETVRSQYSMCLFAMLLSNYWKENIIRSSMTKEIVPYSPRLAAFNSISAFTPLRLEMKADNLNSESSLMGSFSITDEMETADVENSCELMSSSTDANVEENMGNAYDVSEREQYYLQQIEILQHEKKSLRSDFEAGQANDLYKMMSLQSELDSKEKSFQESEEEKCKLILKLQETEYLLSEVDDKHNQRFQQLKHEYSQFIDTLREEHDVMASQYEKRIQEMKNLCNNKEQNLSDLLKQQTNIQLELAPYLQQLSCSDSYHEDQIDKYVGRGQTVVDLVRELVKTASALREKNFELQEKENAYMETINEADKIMSSHVNAYTKQIEQLEESLHIKTSTLSQLEAMIASFKNKQDKTQDGHFIGQIDHLLKDSHEVFSISSDGTDNMKPNNVSRNSESLQKSVDNEFWEKDQLLQKLMKLTSENNTLKSQLQEAHDGSRKLNEAQQSTNFLKGRLEELEMVESLLTEDKKKLETKLFQKEKKWSDTVCRMESEVSALKHRNEQSDEELSRLKSIAGNQKAEIECLKSEINILHSELKENSDETVNFESQHRNEVAKLRAQLKLVNSQLAEIGAINGDLREKLSTCEENLNKVGLQLTEKSKHHERDMLALNLKLNEKDLRIEELEGHLQQVSHSSAANELDFFFSLPASSVHESLVTISESLKDCHRCKNQVGSSIKNLIDASSNVSKLVNGQANHEESSTKMSDVETSGKESWSTDGIGLSEDNTSESLDDLGTTCRDINGKPAAPPRPRRDAKKKRKVKKASRHDNSLLQELKDSANKDDIYWQMPKESLAILNEMKRKVLDMEDIISKKEEEIRLADSESSELHDRLLKEDQIIKEKSVEVEELKSSLSALRGELVKTVEEHERIRQSLVEQHKDQIEGLQKQRNSLQTCFDEVSFKSTEKNILVNTLLKIILLYVRNNGSEISVAMRNIANETRSHGAEEHSLDSICNIVSVMVKKSIVAIPTKEVQSAASSETEKPAESEVSCQSKDRKLLPIRKLDQQPSVKTPATRIPSLKTLGVISKSSPSQNLFSCYPKSKIPRWTQIPNIFKKSPRKEEVKDDSSKFATFSKGSSRKIRRSLTSTGVPHKSLMETSIIKVDSTKLTQKRHVKDVVTSKPSSTKLPEQSQSRKISISKSQSHSSVLSQRRLSDSARALISHESSSTSSEVPRPQNLKITRRVGVDGVVIAWDPMEHGIAGFQVTVDGRLAQQVRSPKRTKALVNGLPFPDGFTIGLVAVSTSGLCSCPALVSYKRSSAYKFPRNRKEHAWGSQQKCIPACF